VELKQDHVFKFEGTLTPEQKEILYKDLKNIDLEQLHQIHQGVIKDTHKSSDPLPFPKVCTAENSTAEDRKRWNELGFQKISEGKLGLLLLAGGQGTRLGTVNPKGMYDIGLPSKKSLFQLQAERLLKVQQIAKQKSGKESVVPWYIMTSDATTAPTRKFFQDNSYFGLDSKNVFFFEQDMLPCVTPEGKIIMESTTKVSRAPNGNGGLYYALLKSGALADMERRGVEIVYQYCVDNSLVKMADPIFVGFCFEKNVDCAAKVVPKAFPEEQVGVLCLIDGKSDVIEYSEIKPELARSLDEKTGNLKFNAAHICMNIFSLKFLQEIAQSHLQNMPYHIAKKKIPCVNAEGKTEAPKENNGWKLESFIFDIFPFAKNMAAFEVARDEEFSPLKNAPGSKTDSPETCSIHLSNLHKKYIQNAGGIVISKGEQDLLELSPFLTHAGEFLEKAKGKEFHTPAEVTTL